MGDIIIVIAQKKPIKIEAIKWTGENWYDILKFTNYTALGSFRMSLYNEDETILIISTLEGDMKADVGDWVIKGIHGEFYPCKHDIFIESYDIVSGCDEVI